MQSALCEAAKELRPERFGLCGVDPQVGPVAFDGALPEGLHLRINLRAQAQDMLLEMPLMSIAYTKSSTERVEMPCMQASCITAASDFSAVLLGSRKGGK